MTDRAVLPDVLSLYHAGSIVIWERKMWGDRSHFVPCLVVGKSKHQGNGRLHVRVLSIKKTPVGPVLFTEEKENIKTTNIISLAEWWQLRHGGPRE